MAAVDQLQSQLQAVLQRQQQMETEIARLVGQNQVLAASGLEQLPRLVASLDQQVSQHGYQRTLVDTRGLGKPERFTAKEGEWQQWSRKFENYVAACHTGADLALEWATDQRENISEEIEEDKFGQDEEG